MGEKVIGIYIAVQNRLIEEYDVTLCDGTINDEPCEYRSYTAHWCAYHVGERNRRIRNWMQENTVLSTFILLHEIGHLNEHYEYRVEDEFEATVWAMRMCAKLRIPIDRETIAEKQADIMRRYDSYADKYADCDSRGTKKPSWLRDRECYNALRVYDRMFARRRVKTAQITYL